MKTAALISSRCQSVESIMRRFSYSPGIRVSQLEARRVEFEKNEPWLTELPSPDPLTRAQEIALLTLRHSDHAQQVIKAMVAKGAARARLADYEALVPHGLAIPDGKGFHSITPIGHYRAGRLTRTRASELGIRLVSYRVPRSGPQRVYGMSDAGNG